MSDASQTASELVPWHWCSSTATTFSPAWRTPCGTANEKLPYAVKLLKEHLKDESKEDTDRTEHAHYFPELDRIVLLEFSTFIPTSDEIGPMMGYAPSKKFPYVINFTLCASEQYDDVVAGRMKLPDNLDIRKSIDIIGMV